MQNNQTELLKIDNVDYYNRISPIDPFILNILAIFLLIIMILGVVLNSILLYIFRINEDLRTPLNVLIIAITALNLVGSLLELPWVIHSCFSYRWTSSKLGCDVSSTIMFFIGCTSAHLMAAISFERFYIMYKPLNIRKINYKKVFIAIGICSGFGLFWAIMPLLGWSYYTFESGLVSCGVEFKGSSFNVRSYIIGIFIFVYLIPFGFIMGSNAFLFLVLKRAPLCEEASDKAIKKRISIQRNVTKSMLLYITGFVVSCTPYAFVSFYTAFIDEDGISPLGTTLPAFFLKSSMVWSTLFYVVTNRNIRSKFRTEKAFSLRNKNDETGHNLVLKLQF